MRDTGETRKIPWILFRCGAIALVIAGVAGCAAVSSVGDALDVPLQAVGLSRPSVPSTPSLPSAPTELPPAPIPPPRIRTVHFTVDASGDLNADDKGRGLALITRIYKLGDSNAFLQAPFDTFLKPEQEKSVLGTDLVDVHELILTPGQHFEAREKLSNESPWLGVVVLFRNPAPYRWRFVFKASEAEKSGILIGAHACALTVTAGLAGNDGGGRPLGQLPPFCP